MFSLKNFLHDISPPDRLHTRRSKTNSTKQHPLPRPARVFLPNPALPPSPANPEEIGKLWEIVRNSEDTYLLHTGMPRNIMTAMPAAEAFLPKDPGGFSMPSFEWKLARSYQIIIQSYANRNGWWNEIENTARLREHKSRTRSAEWMIESSANDIFLQPSDCTSDANEFEKLIKNSRSLIKMDTSGLKIGNL